MTVKLKRTGFLSVAAIATFVMAPNAVSGVEGTGAAVSIVSEAEVARQPSPTELWAADGLGDSSGTDQSVEHTAEVRTLGDDVEHDLGDRFVAAWIDPTHDDSVYIRVTGDPSTVSSSPLDHLADQSEVTLVESSVSADELDQLKAVADSMVGTVIGGSTVVSAATDPVHATIEIGVDGDQVPVRAALRSQPRLVVVATDAPQPFVDHDRLPAESGDRIKRTSDGSWCTLGLVVRRAGQPTGVTAGHCGPVGEGWLVGTELLGTTTDSVIGPQIDASLVSLSDPGPGCVQTDSSGCLTVNFGSGALWVGMSVEKSGARTGDTSGVIRSVDATVQYQNGIVVSNTIGTSVRSDEGDSGSLLFARQSDGTVSPLGILSGGNSFYTYFSNWHLVCTTSGVDAQFCPDANPGWENLGRLSPGAPSVAANSSGRVDVFAKGFGNALMVRTYTRPGWTSWKNLGGYLTSDPSAVSLAGDHLAVVARGGDGQPWLLETDTSGNWKPWSALGGLVIGAPAVSSWGAGRIDVWAQGMDTALWHLPTEPGWRGNWERLGGLLSSAPAATSWGVDRADVVARGVDNTVWTMSWSGTWSGWSSLGAIATGTPGLASRGAERLEAFAIGADRRVWTTPVTAGSASGWRLIDVGASAGGVSAVSPGGHGVELASESLGGNVIHRSLP